MPVRRSGSAIIMIEGFEVRQDLNQPGSPPSAAHLDLRSFDRRERRVSEWLRARRSRAVTATARTVAR
jgi:hypothetical protein